MNSSESLVFTCNRCGKCCLWPGYVRITDAEVDAIAEYLHISVEEFTADYTILTRDRRGLSLIEHPDGRCIFLRHGKVPECAIEPVKPRQCRQFPLSWNFPGWQQECQGTISHK